MRKLLGLLVLAMVSYWAWGHYGYGGDPMYAEIRIKHADTGVELVGLGKMNSQSDCDHRTGMVWGKIFASEQRFEVTSIQCVPALPSRYEDLFADRQIHATYISFTRGSAGERDGRFVIYGVPSSEVARVCPELVQRVKQNYSGKVECVQGTVG